MLVVKAALRFKLGKLGCGQVFRDDLCTFSPYCWSVSGGLILFCGRLGRAFRVVLEVGAFAKSDFFSLVAVLLVVLVVVPLQLASVLLVLCLY